jgi:RNA-directed DNA polymerase
VLDLWFEKAIKPLMEGEAYLVRYIDDFVVCFQYRSDALRFQKVLLKRLEKYALSLAPEKTRLVEFGRFAQKYAEKRGRKRPETLSFLGFTFYCTRNLKGKFKVGMRTENARAHRSLHRFSDLMRRMRHLAIEEQVENLNRVLRGYYAYFGIAGNYMALQRLYRGVERYWKKMLGSRSQKGEISWEMYQNLKRRFELLRPKLVIPYWKLQILAIL